MNKTADTNTVPFAALKKYRMVFQYCLIGICLIIVAWHVINNRQDLAQLRQFSLVHILALYVCWFLIQFISAHQSLFLYTELGMKSVSYLQWLKIYFVSLFLSTSFWQGGKIYRTIVLKKHFAVPYTNSIVFSLFSGWYQSISCLIFANLFLWWADVELSFHGINFLVVMSVIIVLGIVGPFIGRSILPIRGIKSERMLWVQSKVIELIRQIQWCSRPKIFLGLLFHTLLSLPVQAVSIYIFYHGFKVSLSFLETLVFAAVNLIVTAVPITPQNLGTLEIVYGFMSESVGVAFGNSMIVMTGIRIITFVLTALIAIVLEKSIHLKAPDLAPSD